MTSVAGTHTRSVMEAEDRVQIPTYHKMPIAIVRGEGSYVWDLEGRRYLDYYGGHCVTVIGHCPPAVVAAVREQLGQLIFYSNAVYSPVRAQAAELLTAQAPEGLGNVFFCNSGTEANETALKLARKETGRSRVVALEGDFHGRTLGSLATTWGDSYRSPFAAILPETTFVSPGDSDGLEQALGSDDVAAVIVEPIQSIAGVFDVPPSFLRHMRHVCNRHGTLLIFDEVQTGVWRTGPFSISEHAGVYPDIITLAKSLGSGVPVGAVLVADEVASGVTVGDQGSTFGGGMVAMAAVQATLSTVLDQNLKGAAARVFDRVVAGVGHLAREIRGGGCLIGIELDRPAAPVVQSLRESGGVLVGGSAHDKTIRLMPPINTSDREIDAFSNALADALSGSGAGTLDEE